MIWDVINIMDQPKCDFCGNTTRQMAKFHAPIRSGYPIYICMSCAKYVKDAMNNWTEVKDINYIDDVCDAFKSDIIDNIKRERKRLTPADRTLSDKSNDKYKNID